MKRGDGSKRALYHGVLETMDAQLGVLFDHIRGQPSLRDNTLILLCSDNGQEPGAGSPGPFRGSKATLFEGGVRSPLIVWGPGVIAKDKAGHHNQTSVVSALDLAPSLLQLAGVRAPAGVTFDGETLSDTMVGKTEASRKIPLFWRRPPDRKTMPSFGVVEPQPDLAVRDGNWKLLCEYDGSKPQLFNLAEDRAESKNLASQHADIVRRMTASVLAWHASMPADNGPALASTPSPAPKKKKGQ